MSFFYNIKPLDLEEIHYNLQQQELIPSAEYDGTVRIKAFINELIAKEELVRNGQVAPLRTKLKIYSNGLITFQLYLDSSLLHPKVVLHIEKSEDKNNVTYLASFEQQPEGGSMRSHALDDIEYTISQETYEKALEYFTGINSRSLQYSNEWWLENKERAMRLVKNYNEIM